MIAYSYLLQYDHLDHAHGQDVRVTQIKLYYI